MNAQKLGLMTGFLMLAGCASSRVAQKETLNERSEQMAAQETRLPPNPNRPTDTRDLKPVPTVIQHDPALNKPQPDQREDKGLAVNAGKDQLVRTQDPTQTDEAPKSVGGPATAAQKETVSKVDSDLALRVKETITRLQTYGANPSELKADSTNGEQKAIQNLEVTAKSGHITLAGNVASETERSAYEEAALRVPGVSAVSNYLIVAKNDRQ